MGRWLLGIIIIAIVSIILAWIGPWNVHKRSDVLQSLASTSLDNGGFDFAQAETIGHYVTLTGEAPDEAARTAAGEMAMSLNCADCPASDKTWHILDNQITVREVPAVPQVSPFTFEARKTAEGTMALDGYVRDEIEMGRITTEATGLVGADNITSNVLSIAEGAPNADWGNAISKYLQEITLLDQGRLIIRDSEILVTGVTTDEALRARINALATSPIAGYTEAVNITVPEASTAFAGTVDSQELCQSLVDELRGDSRIFFANDSAVIGEDSFSVLQSLASAAQQCPNYSVHVEGHTDSVGDDTYNVDLSNRRALSVARFLVDQNVDAGQVSAIGFGETQPIATNDTAEGRAQNRRIEFIMTQSE